MRVSSFCHNHKMVLSELTKSLAIISPAVLELPLGGHTLYGMVFYFIQNFHPIRRLREGLIWQISSTCVPLHLQYFLGFSFALGIIHTSHLIMRHYFKFRKERVSMQSQSIYIELLKPLKMKDTMVLFLILVPQSNSIFLSIRQTTYILHQSPNDSLQSIFLKKRF